MKTSLFRILLFSILTLGVVCTLVHFFYVLFAYQRCSIIYFIGKELW